jgi:hypothetical protein
MRALYACFIVAGAVIAACSGSDGAIGPAGQTGEAGAPGAPGANGTSYDGGATSKDSSAGSVPAHAPAAIDFFDSDPDEGTIEGVIALTKATNESDVTSYALYYGSTATTKFDPLPITVLQANGKDLQFPITLSPPPAAAQFILAFSSNATGEMPTGVAVPLHDNSKFESIDISVDAGANSGTEPTIAIDSVNEKILVVAANGQGVLTLFRCGLDGTGCTTADVSGGVEFNSAPSITIDTANGKLLVVAALEMSLPHLYRCNLDGTSCTSSDISAGIAVNQQLAVALDTTSSKLLVAGENTGNNNKPSLLRCNLDGTSCTATDISAGDGTNSGVGPAITIDSVNGKVLVVTSDGANNTKPTLFRCNLDGTSCTHTDISAGDGNNSGASVSVGIDSSSSSLVVVSADGSNGGKPTLFRCNLDGTSCTHTDISGGAASGAVPTLAFDTANGKLLTLGASSTNSTFFRSNLDGSQSQYWAVPTTNGTGGPHIVTFGSNGRFVIAAANAANAGKPAIILLE